MTHDYHFKWSSDPLCICLYLGLNPSYLDFLVKKIYSCSFLEIWLSVHDSLIYFTGETDRKFSPVQSLPSQSFKLDKCTEFKLSWSSAFRVFLTIPDVRSGSNDGQKLELYQCDLDPKPVHVRHVDHERRWGNFNRESPGDAHRRGESPGITCSRKRLVLTVDLLWKCMGELISHSRNSWCKYLYIFCTA